MVAWGSSAGWRMFSVACTWGFSLLFMLFGLKHKGSGGSAIRLLCAAETNMHKRANTDALIHTLIWPFPWTGGRQRIRFLSRGLAANVFYLSAVWKNNKIHPGQDPDTICPSLGIGFWGCYLTLYLRLGFCWPVTCCFSQRRLPRVSHEWKQPLVGN